MKAEIMGYITALINVYSKGVKSNTNSIVISCEKRVLNDLTDLIDFVDDTQEPFSLEKINDLFREKVGNLEDRISYEGAQNESLIKQVEQYKDCLSLSYIANAKLRSRIKELEDSCEIMNEVEKNLHKKIEGFEKINTVRQSAYNCLKRKNEKLERNIKGWM